MSRTMEALELPVEQLMAAYARGMFPMVHEDGELYWHDPDPRAVFDLTALQPDRKTARMVRSGAYEFALDRDFELVVRACASREETWIDERIIRSYAELHRAGVAHCVSVRSNGDRVVGGIYGVALGGAFFAESMFGTNNAGKMAFHHMAAHLNANGFLLLDTQYINPFTRQLGAFEIPRARFRELLAQALVADVTF